MNDQNEIAISEGLARIVRAQEHEIEKLKKEKTEDARQLRTLGQRLAETLKNHHDIATSNEHEYYVGSPVEEETLEVLELHKKHTQDKLPVNCPKLEQLSCAVELYIGSPVVQMMTRGKCECQPGLCDGGQPLEPPYHCEFCAFRDQLDTLILQYTATKPQ